MQDISKEALEGLKAEALHWRNNCGGCETCSQVFGSEGKLTIDPETLYALVTMIEERDRKIDLLTTLHPLRNRSKMES